MYAKLFKKFIEITDEFVSVFEHQISSHVKDIKNILYVSPNEDYDKYCDYVKQVESVKNFTSFLIQCSNLDILKSADILELALTFQNYCLSEIDNNDNLLLNEIYVANIALIVKDGGNTFFKDKKWDDFISNHKLLVESQGRGKNKKIYFKLLDISERVYN